MSQATNVIATGSGAAVRTAINAALAAINTGHSGTSAPSYIAAGMLHWRTDVPGGGIWTLYAYDGASSVALGTLNTSTHAWTPAGAGGISPPQGRLCLFTAEPVPGATARTGKTVVYYSPYVGNQIPIYDGAAFAMTTFAELTNDLTQSSTLKAGPAAATTSSNYDLFVWNDSGTLRLSRGPLWTSDTARGTGAGTSELQRVLGIYTNKVAITNGPGANLGTYVGTIRTDGSSQANWNPTPAGGAGGVESKLHVFNAYNRVKAVGRALDTTASWAYTTATWRGTNGSTANRVSYIDGLAEVSVDAKVAVASNGSGGIIGIGVNRDSTSADPSTAGVSQPSSVNNSAVNVNAFVPSLGYHYLQAMEIGAGGVTFYGFQATLGAATNVQIQHLLADMTI